MFELGEWNKLHDITGHVLFESLRVQWDIVGVQHVHGGEVGLAHTDDDDRDRKRRSTHNLVNRLLHVIDDAVRYNQENQVLLIPLRDFQALRHIVDRLHDFMEVCGPMKVSVFDRVLVGIKHTLETVALRVENVAVKGETM